MLDPAQNDTFADHYLGVPFDLSEVLFIATANFIQNIPGPLLDRMEVVEFAGYTEREKLEIARHYLIPRQLKENGARRRSSSTITDEALSEVITGYTREAGVRQLEREIGRLARKVARQDRRRARSSRSTVDRDDGATTCSAGRRSIPRRRPREDQVGVATGMYYTPTGGDIMFVEASHHARQGRAGPHRPARRRDEGVGPRGVDLRPLARGRRSGSPDEMFDRDIHIHVPAGAIPKDGPSAGVTMATALVSALSGRPVRHDIAMTGEITLRGRVLPIGGVKEKVLGAVRAGINRIILPKDNEPDLEDLPKEVRDKIEIYLVQELGEVLALTLRGATLPRGAAALRGREEPAGRDAAVERGSGTRRRRSGGQAVRRPSVKTLRCHGRWTVSRLRCLDRLPPYRPYRLPLLRLLPPQRPHRRVGQLAGGGAVRRVGGPADAHVERDDHSLRRGGRLLAEDPAQLGGEHRGARRRRAPRRIIANSSPP